MEKKYYNYNIKGSNHFIDMSVIYRKNFLTIHFETVSILT